MHRLTTQARHDAHPDNTGLIIHLFAAAHAAIAIIARLLNYDDDIPLTVLSVSMIAVIASRYRLRMGLTAVIILTVTFIGFLSGLYFGQLLYSVIGSLAAASALTTFVLTEIFGWTTYLFVRKNRIPADSGRNRVVETRHIVTAATAVLLLRIIYSLLFRAPYFVIHGGIYAQFGKLFSNTFALLTLLCGTAVFAAFPSGTRRRSVGRVLAEAAFFILFPLLLTIIVRYRFPFVSRYGQLPFGIWEFTGTYAVSLLATVITYIIFMLLKVAEASLSAARRERSGKQIEEYKYAKLKQQISPHFLFNSLNILDFLVRGGENERAAAYIGKLAKLYRYILKNENEPLVTLDEEMQFTEMYTDLLKERFADGLIIENRVPAQMRQRLIVPCSVQMLIENATKHNSVDSDSPLRIRIEVMNEMLSVANNIQPRISRQPSTRLGLENIRRQYEDIAQRTIEVIHNEKEFEVRLPLL
ncbi:MAG: histidine kinase [Alistipes sp.]|nr:histidine kinase [Alistipes sp.]